MSVSSSQDSANRLRRERTYVDQIIEDSPYFKMQRQRSFVRNVHGHSNGDKTYTPSIMAHSPKREKTFYRAANFRDSSPGREKSGATNRSVHADSLRTSTYSTGSRGSRLTREGSFVRSTLTVTSGIPAVPLAEAPTITTTDGHFRLSYNDQNKLSFRRIAVPETPRKLLRDREDSFINDAIVTERRRTKYKDIIPPYSANKDIHAQSYFNRPDVQRLMSTTCTLRPWERDIKPEYLHNEDPYL